MVAASLAPEPQKLGVRFQDEQGMALDVLALECPDGCSAIQAVAYGGNPPYLVQWEDGSTQPVRQVCGRERAELTVRVSDTPVRTAEFDNEPQVVTASIQTRAFDCSDAGVCKPGPGSDTPESGHYEGTGNYTCDNDSSPESAALINQLVVVLDFDVDRNATKLQGPRI